MPEATGLPSGFHDSLRASSQSELDFWRIFNEVLEAARKNPKIAKEKLLELQNRLSNTIYTTSQLVSSTQDVTELLEARTQKLTEFVQAAKVQAEYEDFLVSRAWRFFLLSALSFLLLACFLLLNWLRGKVIRKT
jgi:hypothetical protein